MRKKVNHTYNIQLTSLTPVSIGTSEVLSPYTDFVFDTSNKQIHLLDKRKIADRVLEVANDGTLMDEYVSFIRGTFDNNRSEFDLKAFLESKEKLDLDADDYAAQSIPYYGLNPNDRREIKSTLKNDRQPYISGSTLKGAMKACLLYDWFSEEAKESFNQLMQKTLRLYERCERDIRRLDQMAGKRYLSRDDRFKMRKIKDNIKRGG
ncbi:MAG: type III-A CRISPR-associated RAMP protein Csm5, partial [Bacteroidota bacterium]